MYELDLIWLNWCMVWFKFLNYTGSDWSYQGEFVWMNFMLAHCLIQWHPKLLSATFAWMCNLTIEPFQESVVIALTNGKTVICLKVILRWLLDFGKRILDADLTKCSDLTSFGEWIGYFGILRVSIFGAGCSVFIYVEKPIWNLRVAS